jgi:hypothetical protein
LTVTRITQNAVETLSEVDAKVRITQDAVETLSNVDANVRVTQDVVEVLSTRNLFVRVTQHVVEVLTNRDLSARVTQFVVETLTPNVENQTVTPNAFTENEQFERPGANYEANTVYPAAFSEVEDFSAPSASHQAGTVYPVAFTEQERFEPATVDKRHSEMKGVFEAMLPKGAIWQPREGGNLDKLLDAMGFNAQAIYEEIDKLAALRDPDNTYHLSDLEREYGISGNSNLSDTVRRTALKEAKYALPNTSSWELLQTRLRAAGFDDIIVTPNDPAVDPDLIADGTVLVNGTTYSSQNPAYLMEANNTDLAFAGNGKAVAGYYINVRRNSTEYNISGLPYPYWRFFFFVGGAASGWPGSPAIAYYTVDSGRLEELKRLILKYKPLRSWCILRAGY